jgi:spore maturation protein CgeB
MGYSVDAVDQCVVEDHIVRDDMRSYNAMIGPADSGYYYARYPTVHIPAKQAVFPVQTKLRIMHLPVYEWTFPGRMNKEKGLTEALANYGLAIELDYLNETCDLIEVVRAWQPDLLIMQIQGTGSKMTPYILASMRNACPNTVVVNWNGDIHEAGLVSDGVIALLRYVDLQTTINAKVLPVYEKLGINAAYWQIYFKEPVLPLPDMPAYEVLFSGNCYDDRRTKLVSDLRNTRHPNTRPVNLGVYGNCAYADGNTHYNFSAQASLYQKAKIVVGDTFPGGEGFVSNRLFQVLGNGGFLLQQHSPRLDELTGLQAGTHYAEWTTNKALKEKIMYWLKPENDEKRQEIARQGCEFVRSCYSADAQVRKLFTELLPRIV